MRRIPITLLLATLIILPGCALADAALTDAETVQIETRSDADTITALLVANQTAIDALQIELEAGRADRKETEAVYLELLADQAALLEQMIEQAEPQSVSPWRIIILVVAVGTGMAWYFRHGAGRLTTTYYFPRDRTAGALPHGEQAYIQERRQACQKQDADLHF